MELLEVVSDVLLVDEHIIEGFVRFNGKGHHLVEQVDKGEVAYHHIDDWNLVASPFSLNVTVGSQANPVEIVVGVDLVDNSIAFVGGCEL